MQSAVASSRFFPGLIAILLALGLVSGCAERPVQPWEKAALAEEDMRFSANSVEQAFDEHFYFSKEASSGGRGFAGGGCGCN
jgi:hypothetical protein